MPVVFTAFPCLYLPYHCVSACPRTPAARFVPGCLYCHACHHTLPLPPYCSLETAPPLSLPYSVYSFLPYSWAQASAFSLFSASHTTITPPATPIPPTPAPYTYPPPHLPPKHIPSCHLPHPSPPACVPCLLLVPIQLSSVPSFTIFPSSLTFTLPLPSPFPCLLPMHRPSSLLTLLLLPIATFLPATCALPP